MAPSTIELKVASCKDLKAFNFFQKLSVYAVVSITSDDPEKKQKTLHRQLKTPIDREGDGNPEWNHEMRFDLKEILSSSLDQDNLFLEFRLFSEVIIFGDKTIGEVCVPLKDLVEESKGAVKFMSYQVRNIDRNPNGVLNFSYKVIDDKIGGIVYPAIENNTGFQVVYPPPPECLNPSPESCYPQVEDQNPCSDCGYPPPGIHYPPLDQIHYSSPPPPPLALPLPPEVVYPLPYTPPLSPWVYPMVPGPYEFGSGIHSYPICSYPNTTNNINLCELQDASNAETWRNSSQPR